MTWIYLNLPKFAWIDLKLHEFTFNTWIYLNLPKFPWIYLNLHEVTGMGSLWFTWVFLDLLEFTWVNLGWSGRLLIYGVESGKSNKQTYTGYLEILTDLIDCGRCGQLNTIENTLSNHQTPEHPLSNNWTVGYTM